MNTKYDDIIYGCTSSTSLPANCTITAIELELVDSNDQPLVPRRATQMGQPPAIDGGRGASITKATVGSQALPVCMHSWHDFGSVVRYRLIYYITDMTGSGCSLPPFRLCDGGGPDGIIYPPGCVPP